jgi:hypothetical protein
LAGIETLSNGYEKPTNPTTGAQHFPAMERNVQRMNDHAHDPTGESPTGEQLAAITQAVDSDDWGADLGGGSYRQELTMPAPLEFDTTRIEVRRSTGEIVYPKIVKTAADKFYLYTNDNTASYTISYV